MIGLELQLVISQTQPVTNNCRFSPIIAQDVVRAGSHGFALKESEKERNFLNSDPV